MIFHCQIKRSSVQTRFNKYIFHFQRAGNRQFHRLPNTGRLVTIKTMGYIFQKITLRWYFPIFLFTLTNRRIEEINCSTTRFRSTAICFTDHFHHNQIFTGLQQFTSINLYFTKHTDMWTGKFSININFRNLWNSIKSQRHIFTLNICRQFYPLSVPSCFSFSIIECISFTTHGFLLIISIRDTFGLRSCGRRHCLSM